MAADVGVAWLRREEPRGMQERNCGPETAFRRHLELWNWEVSAKGDTFQLHFTLHFISKLFLVVHLDQHLQMSWSDMEKESFLGGGGGGGGAIVDSRVFLTRANWNLTETKKK